MINMVDLCCGFCLFYIIGGFGLLVATKHDERRRRILWITVLPLPVAYYFGVLFHILATYSDGGNYEPFSFLLTLLALLAGTGTLLHCYHDRNKTRDMNFYLRLAPALFLMASPGLLYFPDIHLLSSTLFFVVGCCFAIYGYPQYMKDRRVGLGYLYLAIVFMIIVPVLQYSIANIYLDNQLEETISHRHAPQETPFAIVDDDDSEVENASFIIPGLLVGTYLALLGILRYQRKARLQKSAEITGLVPEDTKANLAAKGEPEKLSLFTAFKREGYQPALQQEAGNSREQAVLVEEDDLGVAPIPKRKESTLLEKKRPEDSKEKTESDPLGREGEHK